MTDIPPPLLAYRSPDSVPSHWANVTLHRPDPALFWQTYRRNIALQCILRLPRLLILLGIVWYFDPGPFEGGPAIRQLLWTTLAIVIPMGFVLLAVTRYRRERRAFANLEIVVADQGVLRRGGGAPLLEITRPEIARLQTRSDGIAVIARPSVRRIHIHRCLTDFPQLAARLGSWTDIPHQTQSQFHRFGTYALWLLAATASGAAVWALLMAPSLPVRIACLVGLLGFSAFAAWVIARSPNATTFQKTLSLISIGIGILYLAAIFLIRFIHFI